MLSTIYSAGIRGVDGYLVTVECDVRDKLASFEIVGLPDNAVKEAKERIHTAIDNSGITFPDAAIVINMAPADTKKSGTAFDLAMLIGILRSSGYVQPTVKFNDKAFLGELDAARQQELSNAVKAGQNVSLPELELEVEPEVFTLNSKPLDNVAIYSNNGEFVALDTTISDELARAGILRDIVRQCQVFRKAAGFDVSDRIYIAFETESELIKSIIAEKQAQLEHDLLATFETPANVEYTGTIDLDGVIITVSLQRK